MTGFFPTLAPEDSRWRNVTTERHNVTLCDVTIEIHRICISMVLVWMQRAYIAVADPWCTCVTGTDHPPPLWNVDDVTRAMSKGVCACECSRVGVFFNFSEGGWRHADNVQGGGGGACECLHPPFREIPMILCAGKDPPRDPRPTNGGSL